MGMDGTSFAFPVRNPSDETPLLVPYDAAYLAPTATRPQFPVPAPETNIYKAI